MISMFLTTVETTGDMVAKAVQNIDFSPIFTEYMNVLPVVLPISILFISVKKAVGAVLGTLHSV